MRIYSVYRTNIVNNRGVYSKKKNLKKYRSNNYNEI